eukprot:TRINITY_DN3677_c0_g1_i1.p1 TRINITY_DN3677_c0_g1~~TRINITY_DN3677_c0_g1_i1.p1  ORF type:complete len:250 (-),score=46.63 TRINITY_DN3677_c0_g1_i1:379-1128(-)
MCIRDSYMIDTNWWNKWKAFTTNKDKKVSPPGPIYNVPLVNLSIEYEVELGRAAGISKPLDDWKKMSLKPHLVEGQDYIFVGEKVWKYLQSLYKGWPEIRLQVVGDTYQPGFEKGSPDLSPFRLTILEEVDAKRPALSSGILVSKKANMTLLKKIIADKLDMKISGMSCKYFDPGTKNTKFVKAGSSSIEENNIHNNSEIIVNSLTEGGSSRSSNAPSAASGQKKRQKNMLGRKRRRAQQSTQVIQIGI